MTALERASGCLVQGVWVELFDPKGKAVPRARVQTQQGLGYLGGLKLEDAGLYHLWIYAKDTGGKVVSEGYLPIQVKDRGKTPFETVNGRYFTTRDGASWTESTPPTRGTASVSGGNPFAAFAAAFQQLVTGIANSILGTKPKADAAKAVAVLKDPKLSVQERVLTVKSKWDIHPAFLVTTPSAQPADPHPAAVSGEKMKLVSHDGGSLVSHDGGSLVSQDGGTLVAGGGNLIAGAGAGNGRSLNSATTTVPSGSCANGYKTVGAGKTVTTGARQQQRPAHRRHLRHLRQERDARQRIHRWESHRDRYRER